MELILMTSVRYGENKILEIKNEKNIPACNHFIHPRRLFKRKRRHHGRLEIDILW
jgi:hypothetical protein